MTIFFPLRLSIRNLNKFVAPKKHSKITMCSANCYDNFVFFCGKFNNFKVGCAKFDAFYFFLFSFSPAIFFFYILFSSLSFFFQICTRFTQSTLFLLFFFFFFIFFAQLKHFEWNEKKKTDTHRNKNEAKTSLWFLCVSKLEVFNGFLGASRVKNHTRTQISLSQSLGTQ